jgi:beta-glucosidase
MRKQISRRQFGEVIGAATLASATIGSTGAAPRPGAAAGDYYRFPEGFVWGCATAAYQVEGAAAEDGRKPSVWDTFSHTPGKTQNGDTGDVADDSYHRYKQDIHLLNSLGVHAYRFSISWPRVFPDGTGQPNEKGIAFYERLVDELAANGIDPCATLFHWDLPQALEDRWGGWQSQETSKAFGSYAEFVAKRLSDRIHRFFTINEFSCFTDEGYGSGTKAPGKKLPAAVVNQVRHNAVLGHGMAVQALRAAGRSGTQVGIAENAHIAVPVIESAAHVKAAQKAMREMNAPFLTAFLEGRYPDSYLSSAGQDAPKFTAREMDVIGSPLDFVGVNVYTPTYICAADSPSGYAEAPRPASAPHMASAWLYLGPEIGYWAPRHLGEIWKVNNVYITENGCSSDDRIAEDGRIYDTDRVMYLRNHLVHAHRAAAEGWPLRGYFLWSLMDNFEWTDGYGKRFGIHYVDFETQRRLPKLSAEYYREVIARNCAV